MLDVPVLAVYVRVDLQGMQITGIDPNPAMGPYALEAAQTANLDTTQISLLQGTAEVLPVASQSQDCVVCTLVSSRKEL